MIKREEKDIYFYHTIAFSFLAAAITFGYFILKDHGFFTVVDDFNSQ